MEFRERNLADIKRCESGGDYGAINWDDYHPSWDTYGSFGAYQIAQPLWDEHAPQVALHPLRNYEHVRPDKAPPWVQDRVAESLWDDYHNSTEGIGLLWRHKGDC